MDASGSTTQESENSDHKLVWAIAIIGAIPMVLFSAIIVVAGGRSGFAAPFIDAYKVFSAIILSFLGGIHWGIVLGSGNDHFSGKALVISLIAPLIGWIAFFVSEPMCFALLMVGFAGQGAWDNFAVHKGHLPLWYSKTRMILTLVVILSMAAIMYATA